MKIKDSGPGLEVGRDQKGEPELEWRRRYQEYLRSPEWGAQRRRALNRSGNRCERCGNFEGRYVHHLNYARLGNERLTDLLVVCKGCHDEIHRGRPFKNLLAIPEQKVEKRPESQELRARVALSKKIGDRRATPGCQCRKCQEIQRRFDRLRG